MKLPRLMPVSTTGIGITPVAAVFATVDLGFLEVVVSQARTYLRLPGSFAIQQSWARREDEPLSR
jgi:hypothetical protein